MRSIHLACLAVAIVSCSKSNNVVVPPDPPLNEASKWEDEAPPTWTRVYAEVISQKCVPCHATDVGASRGGLDMSSKSTAYANLVNAPSEGEACTEGGTRVQPGNADDSIMYLKVSLDD